MFLLFAHTSSGEGIYHIGTFRSRVRAEALAQRLNDLYGEDEYGNREDPYEVHKLDNLDKYTDESIIEYARSL